MFSQFKNHWSAWIVSVLFAVSAWAADTRCDICGMAIPDHARNHLILKSTHAKEFHTCSLSCVRKAKRHDPTLSQAEVVDFNHPEKWLSGEKAFFLIQSEKIKVDLGEMAMPPYIAAFRTQKEAEAARVKYGEGRVVQGLENALK